MPIDMVVSDVGCVRGEFMGARGEFIGALGGEDEKDEENEDEVMAGLQANEVCCCCCWCWWSYGIDIGTED